MLRTILCSAVAQTACWGWRQLVHEKASAVANLNLDSPPATVASPVETNLPSNHPFSSGRVLAAQPARGVGTTAMGRHACARYLGPCCTGQAVPRGPQGAVTRGVDYAGRHTPTSVVEIGVEFAFQIQRDRDP